MASTSQQPSQCPVCGDADRAPIRRHTHGHQHYTLYQCADCPTQFWFPLQRPPAEFYSDESLSMYSDLHEGNVNALDDVRFRKFFETFDPPRTANVLDIGCGSGTFLEEIHRRGHKTWGVDYDKVSIQRAQARGLDNIFCSTLEDFVQTVPEQHFDYITAFDVLEHLVDPVSTVRALAKLLKSDGTLTVTVPNRHRILANAMSTDFPPHHFFRFDQPAIKRTLQEAGLQAIETQVFQYGYAGPTAADVAIKSVQRHLASGASTGSTSSLTDSDAKPEPKPKGTLRSLAKAAIHSTIGPSRWLEQKLGRGFKIIATAKRAAS